MPRSRSGNTVPFTVNGIVSYTDNSHCQGPDLATPFHYFRVQLTIRYTVAAYKSINYINHWSDAFLQFSALKKLSPMIIKISLSNIMFWKNYIKVSVLWIPGSKLFCRIWLLVWTDKFFALKTFNIRTYCLTSVKIWKVFVT